MQRRPLLTMASSIYHLSYQSRRPACTLPPIPESRSVFSVHYQTAFPEPFNAYEIEYVDDDESSLGSLESCCCSECQRITDVDAEILFSSGPATPLRAPTPDECDNPSESSDSHTSMSPIIPTSETRKKKTPLSFLRSFRVLSPGIPSRDPEAGSEGQPAEAEGTVNKGKGIFRSLKSRLLNPREMASLNNAADDDSKSESSKSENRSPRAGILPRLHSF
ncbi:uncharacterized protein EV420DRAFT_1585945 [Desarmillaria tabescens]|uniref:Uncharacterized protein n=1 Tax=Armillaria tabescens TaxID=1929756 RepID=A0AA39ML71_ARMTA|nr:uncharacterized protein EV420DRAFT_1585945 [Desarmillaria tabescens]KAK0438347.1 hypothetical protein EV420DRAFT_1585945 [Desarmillaria tabescens]